MSNGFAALQTDEDDSSDGSSGNGDGRPSLAPSAEGASVTVPAYEDLSAARMYEENALIAIYGDDFSSSPGVWNCPCWSVKLRPPDLEPSKVGSSLTLLCQITKKYPYVAPNIELREVKGLSSAEQRELGQELLLLAKDFAQKGQEMIFPLVHICENYLSKHNRDPNMSEWEHMQEREKNKREQENEANEALDKLMAKEAPSVTFHDTSGRQADPAKVGSQDVERELLRQREAMEAAQRLRIPIGDGLLRRTSSGTVEQSPDEEDFDIDLDYNPAAVSASRYETDFIEMGVLGRGGGGEVVKARNRLDGRIYAIKKIILEREDGSMAKYGALHNQKLRREVTTISRMTHNNIVRYYQAWVEGDGNEDEPSSKMGESHATVGFEPSTGPVNMIEEGSEDEESESSAGWWVSPPAGRRTPQSAGSRRDESDDTGEDFMEKITSKESDIFDNDFVAPSPLMNGLGFQNAVYNNMVRGGDSSSNSESAEEESVWEEDSSVKVGTGVKGRKILYIQMEFCSTTLRKLIDDRELDKMEDNEKWRFVRQIIEALAYIHGRKLIHRDLKPGKANAATFWLAMSHCLTIVQETSLLIRKETFDLGISDLPQNIGRKSKKSPMTTTMIRRQVRFITL